MIFYIEHPIVGVLLSICVKNHKTKQNENQNRQHVRKSGHDGLGDGAQLGHKIKHGADPGRKHQHGKADDNGDEHELQGVAGDEGHLLYLKAQTLNRFMDYYNDVVIRTYD